MNTQNGQTHTLKPIETKYNGDKFRSRLEAKFAVFFTELGIKYRYETEGYDLGEAGNYLPDFYLSESQTYVEIKPQKPADEEIAKARAMHEQSGKDVVILYGQLDPHDLGAVIFPESRIIGQQSPHNALRFIKYLSYCELRKSARSLLSYLDGVEAYPEFAYNDLNKASSQPLIMFQKSPQTALTIARQARFEHGRRGT